jgi:predicted phosphoribosyltransferase
VRIVLATAHFVDRYDAGRRLGVALHRYATARPPIVLGLPRGGVPVAACVAEALEAPLDVFIVRKLGVPGYEELALGAIASGPVRVLNDDVIDELNIPDEVVERVVAAEIRQLERREHVYRGDDPFPPIAGETVIVVDDGAATGASMRAAVLALRELEPTAIIVALPVASRDAVRLLRRVADDCTCIIAPEPFYGVGRWYGDFTQVSDEKVRILLAAARRRWAGANPAYTR